ncbi:translocation/assembly module TamB domain-containing protein [Niveispirillum sp. BGYR6]|uniref:translocation/assembly module TamB domain-containing protein n=1 Tax=Niveispirillum sp. BGYR6 TaxID=2971249 RepID=UPI0022B98EA9|nr:translocation/assembly module TamB domain-containing protein [Niveispirillum sp. BGYR6]MDG5496780.1 translocation/assembly module TamB domain-containing protein [Niveispirillum sp. BGYR6]
MNMRSPLAWIAAGFASLIGLAVLIFTVAIIWLGTGSGRDFVLAQARQSVPGLGLEGASGNLFDLRLTRLTMADAQGVWLTVEGARLSWSPWALLSRLVSVEALTADRVAVARQPLPGPEEPADPNAAPFRLPVAIDLRQLAVGRAELGPDLLGGTAALLKLAGRADIPAGAPGGNVHLDVARIDDRPGTLTLDAFYQPGSRLKLAAVAAEPENGLVAELLDIPGRPAFTVTLEGDGPLTDWTGNLSAKAGDVVNGRAQARIRPAADKLTFGLEADGNIQALLPANWRALVGPELKLGAGGLIHPGKEIVLDGVSIQIAAGTLAGGGAYNLTTKAVNLGTLIQVPAESALHAFLGETRYFETARGTVTMTGTPQVPKLVTDFTVMAPRFAEFGADSVTLKGTAAAEGSLDRIVLDLTSALEGMRGGGITNQRGTLALTGDIRVPQQSINITSLSLDGPLLKASGKGAFTQWGAAGQADLVLESPNLATLSPLAGRDLSGALAADVTLKRAGGELTASIKARGRDLKTATPAADALLGATTDLSVTLSAGKEIQLRDLVLTSPHLDLRGAVALAGQRLTSDLTAKIDDLSPLGPALGMAMAGGVTASIKAEGPEGATRLALRLDGSNLVLDGLQVGAAQVTFTGQGGPKSARGKLSAETSVIGQRVAANGDIALEGDRLALDNLSAVIGINRIDGGIRTNLSTGTAEGKLTGTVPDLGIIGFIAGDEVWGNGRFSLDLAVVRGQQQVSFTADFKEIWRRWHGQRIAAVAVDSKVEDALAKPVLDVSLQAKGIDPGNAHVDTLTATAKGPLTGTAVTLDLSGKASAPVKVSLAGTFSTPENKEGGGVMLRLLLSRFTGSYGDTGFQTAQPAELAYGTGVVLVKDLALISGDSRVVMNADLNRRALSARAEMVKVPLTWARIIDPTLTLYGELNGTASIGGTVAAPEGTLSLKLDRFSITPPVEKGPAPLGAELAATWRHGRVALTAKLDSQGGGVGLTARGELPLVMDGNATAISLPDDQPISGRLEGDMALNRFNDFLAGSGDRLGGQMKVDLSLAGTLAHRQLSGTVELQGASYENQEWGTRITDITALMQGDPEGLVIRSFDGKTPGGGQVSLAGSIGFRPERGDRQIDLKLTARKARLAQIDMVEATAGAAIAVTGTLTDILVAGRVDVEEAHVRIPDKLPTSVADLPVVEINHPRRIAPPAGASSAVAQPVGAPPKALVVRLEVDVEAPNRLYVTGRGLDAELKASLKVRGTLDDPSVSGPISLVKGDLALLGQTFTIARSNITFDGSLDPTLDVEARTQRGELTAIVAIGGRPSKPSVKLSSQPPYPEDEVLARLLFNRGAGQLSALEALQLAQSAAQLTGLFGGGPGLVDNVKRSLGVDRLEFRGSENGTGAGTVAAGRYIGENLYVGVEQQLGTGESKATVEYGITQHIKARGELGTESKVGVQFEWDY